GRYLTRKIPYRQRGNERNQLCDRNYNTLGRNVPKTFILVVKTSTVVPRNYSAIVRGAFD
ncbi:hypothetical protein QP378_10440, partial [Bifidobacterium breve]